MHVFEDPSPVNPYIDEMLVEEDIDSNGDTSEDFLDGGFYADHIDASLDPLWDQPTAMDSYFYALSGATLYELIFVLTYSLVPWNTS